MPIIDNSQSTMQQAILNALDTSDSIDICVGYFYFSGFQALADKLENKKIRILVGLEVDPAKVHLITRNPDLSLDRYAPENVTTSQITLRENYVDTLVSLVNDSDAFDSEESASVFDLFLKKLRDGTLEIRKTLRDEHGKFYVIHNAPEFAQGGDFPGTVLMGSSNLTYRGLAGQGELNDSFRDQNKYKEYKDKFQALWSTSNTLLIADQSNAERFISEVTSRLWLYQSPTPYEMYVRVLSENFSSLRNEDGIRTPAEISDGEFLDLEYQTDAIRMGIDRLAKFDGVIIADVVGLGKSIIAASISANLDMSTVIIAPPHLIPQWEDYKETFGIRGSKVHSAGSMSQVLERYRTSARPILIIVDEAHRFRNEDTNDYKALHQICRSHPLNKVVLLTATPFNNSPQDVFALMKLFQTPGYSTIKTVDNLSLRFRELIQKYKKLRVDMRRSPTSDFQKVRDEISREQRRFLEPVMIRRSRIDLEYVERYRADLERQGISLPVIEGPDIIEYDLGTVTDFYLRTLESIGNPENEQGFIGARYMPVTYVQDLEKFNSQYSQRFETSELRLAQTNLADFMRKLLVMRFESSRNAFKTTLDRMIANNELVRDWWIQLGIVPIMKKGSLPDPNDYNAEDGEIDDDLEARLDFLRSNKGLVEIPIEWMDPKFLIDVEHDISLLREIRSLWFDEDIALHGDPKLDEIFDYVSTMRELDPDRKIVIFSSFADTVEYVAEEFARRGVTGVLAFTAAKSSSASRKTLIQNFDASYRGQQLDDFSVLVCTDALSEGVNLNRAGAIINYDIPYNPTRVIQRIGRINRINRRMFDSLKIFNAFPTVVGEEETRLKAISTLKMDLINNVVGSDTRTLTPEEDLKSFFQDEFKSAEEALDGGLTGEAFHLAQYESAFQNSGAIASANSIPRRTRIGRKNGQSFGEAIVFYKQGENSVFVRSSSDDASAEFLTLEEGLNAFFATPAETAEEASGYFPALFEAAKAKIQAVAPLPEIRGRRADAVQVLEAIKFHIADAQPYCADLIKVIKEYDDVSEGVLREIALAANEDPAWTYEEVQRIVPSSFIRSVLDRVQRVERKSEQIVLSEEFLP